MQASRHMTFHKCLLFVLIKPGKIDMITYLLNKKLKKVLAKKGRGVESENRK